MLDQLQGSERESSRALFESLSFFAHDRGERNVVPQSGNLATNRSINQSAILESFNPSIHQSINDRQIIQSPNHQIRYLTDTPAPMTNSVVLGLPRKPATNGVPGLMA